MISQVFLESAGSHVMCVIKSVCPLSEIKGAVLLIPGYSQSMCDTDYFMTRLSNELVNQRYATLQLDMYGHGDSYGDLSGLDWATIKSNIESACEYMKEWCKYKTLVGISRGLFANALCIDNISEKFDYVICVNPITIKFDMSKYNKYHKNELTDIADLIANRDFPEGLFALMGAETTNIMGQKINLSFLYETLTLINNFSCQPNATILSTYNDNAEIKDGSIAFSQDSNFSIEYLSRRCFLREHEWQDCLIHEIVKNVIKGEQTGEDTVSN